VFKAIEASFDLPFAGYICERVSRRNRIHADTFCANFTGQAFGNNIDAPFAG
jgi:hypothetical protein